VTDRLTTYPIHPAGSLNSKLVVSGILPMQRSLLFESYHIVIIGESVARGEI
jgi:hypothetical protein